MARAFEQAHKHPWHSLDSLASGGPCWGTTSIDFNVTKKETKMNKEELQKQYAKLEKDMAELKRLIDEPEYTTRRWTKPTGKAFYYLNGQGEVKGPYSPTSISWPRHYEHNANYFESKELAETVAKNRKIHYRFIYNNMANIADRNFWENKPHAYKYYLTFNRQIKKVTITYTLNEFDPSRVYFKTKLDAENAMSNLIITFGHEAVTNYLTVGVI